MDHEPRLGTCPPRLGAPVGDHRSGVEPFRRRRSPEQPVARPSLRGWPAVRLMGAGHCNRRRLRRRGRVLDATRDWEPPDTTTVSSSSRRGCASGTSA